MNTLSKLALGALIVAFVVIGVYALIDDLRMRTIEAEVAKRAAAAPDATKAKRDEAFRRFRECVRNGETWNNCIEEN